MKAMKSWFAAMSMSMAASAPMASAMARNITDIKVYDSAGSGSYTCSVAFDAGETGDAHCLYFAWSESGDLGDTLSSWASVYRVGYVDAADTAKTFALPAGVNAAIAASPDTFAARAFLAASDRDYDYLVQGTKSTTGAKKDSNASFITTGVTPKGKTFAISVDCALNNASDYGYQLFGGNGNTSYMCVGAYIPSSKKWVFYCANNSSSTALDTGLAISTARVNVSLDATGGYPTGTVTVASSGARYAIASTTATSTKNGFGLTLFARSTNSGGTTCDRSCAATVYGCVITNNGVRVRDYRPAVKGGVAGMWDAVNNKFYKSSGVAFTAVGTNTTYFVADGDVQVAASQKWALRSFVDYVWTGEGGDGLLTTDANWRDGSAPDLSNGFANLVFGEGTYNATVAGEIHVNAISFARGTSFSLNASGAAAKIFIGGGGISTSNSADTGNVVYTLGVPVQFEVAPQNWDVATRTILDLRAPISTPGFESQTFTIASPGQVLFHADSPDMTSPLVMTGLTEAFRPTVYTRNGLGASTRTARFTGSAPPLFCTDSGSLTNDVPVDVPANSTLRLNSSANHPLHMNGLVTVDTRTRTLAGNAVYFHGGIKCATSTCRLDLYGSTYVEDTFSGSSSILIDGNTDGVVYLSAMSQTAYSSLNLVKARLVCLDDYVLCRTCTLEVGSSTSGLYTQNGATIDLNGHNQRIGSLKRGWDYNGTYTAQKNGYATITSEKPASLEVASSVSSGMTYLYSAFSFTGAAGFHFCGTGTFGFTNRTSTTRGELRVSSGNVSLWAGSGWVATTNAVIEGSGILHVRANAGDRAFGASAGRSSCNMTVSGSGVIDIAANETATVRTLAYDAGEGEPAYFKPGVYGGSDAGLDAEHTLSFIAGSGRLRVIRDGAASGTILIFR